MDIPEVAVGISMPGEPVLRRRGADRRRDANHLLGTVGGACADRPGVGVIVTLLTLNVIGPHSRTRAWFGRPSSAGTRAASCGASGCAGALGTSTSATASAPRAAAVLRTPLRVTTRWTK